MTSHLFGISTKSSQCFDVLSIIVPTKSLPLHVLIESFRFSTLKLTQKIIIDFKDINIS